MVKALETTFYVIHMMYKFWGTNQQ